MYQFQKLIRSHRLTQFPQHEIIHITIRATPLEQQLGVLKAMIIAMLMLILMMMIGILVMMMIVRERYQIGTDGQHNGVRIGIWRQIRIVVTDLRRRRQIVFVTSVQAQCIKHAKGNAQRLF